MTIKYQGRNSARKNPKRAYANVECCPDKP
jgi:hypothetical protein